jgi:CRP/FNR family cyclic AMP-dependent transcriptional regulator
MNSSKLWYLKRINLFRCLSPEELEKVGRIAQHRTYQRRQLVFSPDDQGDAVYLLKRGRVKLSRFDDKGKEITLAILEEGEFFGEEALTRVAKRSAYAEALEEAVIGRIDRGDFERLLESNADLALRVARQMSERLLGAQSRIESLAFRDVPQRLAGALLELARDHGGEVEDGKIRIQVRLTHQELASLIASTRETTTTLLNRFKREGWVESDGRWIIVSDPAALEAFSRTS